MTGKPPRNPWLGYQHEPTRKLLRQRGCLQLLKQELICRKTHLDQEEARRDTFNYIVMFYNPKRRHSYANNTPQA